MTLKAEHSLQFINYSYFCKFGLTVAYESAMRSYFSMSAVCTYFWESERDIIVVSSFSPREYFA